MNLEEAPDVLTVQEAARIARVGRNAMYGLVASGDVWSVRIGRSLRIPKVALARFLQGPLGDRPEDRP
ncbi:MAG: helix-turn-helix domain-containing protein [Chloroflexota bacterium]